MESKKSSMGLDSKTTNEIDPRDELLVARAAGLMRELDIRKALYAELDEILLALAQRGFVRTELNGQVISLVDKFADGVNTGWTSAAVRRYDLVIENAGKVARRDAKRKNEGGEP